MDHGDRKLPPAAPECRDAADVAMLVTAPAGDPEAATFLTHAATCDQCGPLVEAATHTGDPSDAERALVSQLDTAGAEWQRRMAARFAAGRRPGTRWVWVAATAGLGAAAALLVALRVGRAPSSSRPELQELVAAVAADPQRPVDGRLTGGFPYLPPPTLLRGPSEPASPRVRIAEAKLEEAARASDTPATEAALGVGLLATGDLDKAIESLERAVRDRPGDARFQSDLSAAYIARAKWRDRAEDWPRALAAAERALKANPALAEAQFNRALALEGLHLNAQALTAWTSYASVETVRAWAEEGRRHARELSPQSRANPPAGNQPLRERIEEVLLRQWGEAVMAGETATAQRLLADADRASNMLVQAGGDTMARDEVSLIERVRPGSARAAHLAEGHVLYGEARASFLATRLDEASRLMSRAASLLRPEHSPYADWDPIFRAISVRVAGAPLRALGILRRIDLARTPPTYHHLIGRYHWTRAVALEGLGRLDAARADLLSAVKAFDAGREVEYASTLHTGLGELDWYLGDRRSMWANEAAALAGLAQTPGRGRGATTLINGSDFSLRDDLPEVALHFQSELIRALDVDATGSFSADALMRRARVYSRLGDVRAEVNDLSTAGQLVERIVDTGLRDRTRAELNRARAELLESVDPDVALAAASDALAYYQTQPFTYRVGELLLRRARLRERRDDTHGARDDYAQALDAFDVARDALGSPQERIQAFNLRRAAYRDAVRFEARVRGDATLALHIAERGRVQPIGTHALDPCLDSRRLPPNVAVAYFSVLSDELLAWIVTSEGCRPVRLPIPSRALVTASRELSGLPQNEWTFAGLPPSTQSVLCQLADLVTGLPRVKQTVVIVPDGPLYDVPFAALRDSSGQRIVASRATAIATSFTAFMDASTRLARFTPDRVLAIGDGHDTERSGLPRLIGANDEAVAVARLYQHGETLVGSDATIRNVLAAPHAVIHFAGHTVVNNDFPFLSRMWLAPSRHGARDDGIWLASAIAGAHLQRTGVVVLATCAAASGRAYDGEGAVSMATAFLDAGVASVVASLWPVEDSAHELLMTFHRQLIARGDSAQALRAAQLALLTRYPNAPLRVWSGFVALGGVAPARTS